MEDVISISFSIFFWMIAARNNAICDTLAHHYSISIYSDKSKYPEQFWNPELSWKNKYVDGDPKKGHKKMKFIFWKIDTPEFMSDKWHLYKTLMLVHVINSIILYRDLGIWSLITFAFYGLAWVLTFNYYYNKKLLK